MKLKPEDGYWTLASSSLGDWIRGSSFLKKHKRGLLIVVSLVFFFGGWYLFHNQLGIITDETHPIIIGGLGTFAILVPVAIYYIIERMLPEEGR